MNDPEELCLKDPVLLLISAGSKYGPGRTTNVCALSVE